MAKGRLSPLLCNVNTSGAPLAMACDNDHDFRNNLGENPEEGDGKLRTKSVGEEIVRFDSPRSGDRM
jgi:hypothetical protein